VQPEHYFVLGDHRGQSQDSRFWGTVPESYLKGRAVSIWWSAKPSPGLDFLGDNGPVAHWLSLPAEYVNSIRHERMGRPLELPEY